MATPILNQIPSPPSTTISPGASTSQNARLQRRFQGCSKITEYELLGKLGEGTFGEVHRAQSRKTGTVVALKKILMHNEKDGFPITALREIKLLKLLKHPNVLQLVEMSIEHQLDPKNKRKRCIMYMVTPYMDHDLSGLLENPSVVFTEPQIKCYLMQLLEGLRYLHDSHILHRDMKAANLLINNKGILQIADFGLARHYDEPVPVRGSGGGEAHRDYTTLVVTRWYRPPELLLGLTKYTTAIDLWGVGCVFGEMLVGKPILTGESDHHQMKIIFDLVGSPTDDNMPGWRQLRGAPAVPSPPRPSTLSQRFREHGSGAISLLSELLKLDWRKRLNAIDALRHPYFRNAPLPAKPGEIPTFEESHELDRRNFRGQKAAPPPAPKGGTVGMGPTGGWNGEAAPGHNPAFANGDGYGRHPPPHQNGSRYPPHPPHMNGGPSGEERKPAWRRDDRRPDSRLPPRPPPAAEFDGGRSDRDPYRSRSRDLDRGGDRQAGQRPRPNVDTYIPSYGADSGPPRRDDRPPRDPRDPRDDRRRRDDRDDRRHDRGGRLDYDDRSRNGRTRSRSPVRERERDNFREREPLERDNIYRR